MNKDILKTATTLDIPATSLVYWERKGLLSFMNPKGKGFKEPNYAVSKKLHPLKKSNNTPRRLPASKSLRPIFDFRNVLKARFIRECRQQGLSLQYLARIIKKAGAQWEYSLSLYPKGLLKAPPILAPLDRAGCSQASSASLLDLESGQFFFDFKATLSPSLLHRNKNDGNRTLQPRSPQSKAKSKVVVAKKHLRFQMAAKEQRLKKLKMEYRIAREKEARVEAVAILKRMIALDTENFDFWVELGNLQCSAKNYEEALSAYNYAQSLSQESPELMYSIASLHMQQERFAPAIAYFQKCLDVDPEFWPSYYNLGMAFCTLRYYDEAIELWETYLELLQYTHKELSPEDKIWASQIEQLLEDMHSTLNAD